MLDNKALQNFQESYAELVKIVKEFQREGYSPEEIAKEMPEVAKELEGIFISSFRGSGVFDDSTAKAFADAYLKVCVQNLKNEVSIPFEYRQSLVNSINTTLKLPTNTASESMTSFLSIGLAEYLKGTPTNEAYKIAARKVIQEYYPAMPDFTREVVIQIFWTAIEDEDCKKDSTKIWNCVFKALESIYNFKPSLANQH